MCTCSEYSANFYFTVVAFPYILEVPLPFCLCVTSLEHDATSWTFVGSCNGKIISFSVKIQRCHFINKQLFLLRTEKPFQKFIFKITLAPCSHFIKALQFRRARAGDGYQVDWQVSDFTNIRSPIWEKILMLGNFLLYSKIWFKDSNYNIYFGDFLEKLL